MTAGLKTVGVGLATFVAVWIVAYVILITAILINEAGLEPQAERFKTVLAFATFAAVAGCGAIILFALPFKLGDLLRVHPVPCLIVACALIGLTVYWLFLWVSVTNDCSYGVSVPFSWVKDCSESQ